MIVVDDKPLDLTSGKGDLEKWVIGKINDVREKKKIVFDRGFAHDENGALFRPTTSFPLEITKQDEKTGVHHRWMYTTRKPIIANGRADYFADMYSAQTDITLDPKSNPELSFFMYYILNDALGSYGYALKDYDKEASDDNEKMALETEVRYLILKDLNDSDIILRCHAWGVDVTDEKTIAILKHDLINAVALAEKAGLERGYKSFIEEAKDNSVELTYTAYITKAFNSGVLQFDKPTRKVLYTGSTEPVIIVPAMKTNDYITVTVKHILSDTKAKRVFDMTMAGELEGLATISDDYKNIKNNRELAKWAIEKAGLAKEDVKPGTSNEEIIALIEERIN